MSLQASTSRLMQRHLRQLTHAQTLPGTSYCSCSGSTAGWTARSRWQSTRLQSTGAAASDAVNTQHQKPEDHDIVIVGGGLVGLALANALCMSDRSADLDAYRLELTGANGHCCRSYYGVLQLPRLSFRMQAPKYRSSKAAILTRLPTGNCHLGNGQIEYRVLHRKVSVSYQVCSCHQFHLEIIPLNSPYHRRHWRMAAARYVKD